MNGWGYHWTRCGNSGNAIGGVVILIIALIVFAKAIETALIELAIVMGICFGSIAGIAVIVAFLMAKKGKRRGTLVRDRRVTMELPMDVRAMKGFREWVKLSHAEQCSKEWDWLTGLTDENRKAAQAELERPYEDG